MDLLSSYQDSLNERAILSIIENEACKNVIENNLMTEYSSENLETLPKQAI